MDLTLGVGEQDGPAVGGRAFGQARRQRALPAGARVECLVLEAQRGAVGDQGKLLAGRIEGGALAVDQLSGEADKGNGDEAGKQHRHEAAEPLVVRKVTADDRAEILPLRSRESESPTRRARPRHSVPL